MNIIHPARVLIDAIVTTACSFSDLLLTAMSAEAHLNLLGLPLEILRLIARCALTNDLPGIGSRGLLFQDSYMDVVRSWRSLEDAAPPECTPELSCHSRRSARSGQAVICAKDDMGPARSALDLMYVCKALNKVLLHDALFWGEALLIRPSAFKVAVKRASSGVEGARLSFTAHGGACLCVLDVLLRQFDYITRIDLALPSTTADNDTSPSHLICQELKLGAPFLEAVDLRFDWAHEHADARQKEIVVLTAVHTSRLMNATFAIASTALTSLYMAAEEPVFRWYRCDVYTILRACPNLQNVALQMITVDCDELPFPQRLEYPDAGVVNLPLLSYMHISDKLVEWTYASQCMVIPASARVHADVILPMSRLVAYTMQDLQEDCEASMTNSNLRDIGLRFPVMALRQRPSTSAAGTPYKWPEYVSLSFGDKEESAMAFRDPITAASAGSFSVRNAALSLTSVETPWIHAPNGPLTRLTTTDTMFKACSKLGIRHVSTFIVDASPPFSCPQNWRELLSHLPRLRILVLYGVQSFLEPVVLDLAKALGTQYIVLDDSVGSPPVVFPSESLQLVRLPHAKDPHAAVNVLNARLKERYKCAGLQIFWTR